MQNSAESCFHTRAVAAPDHILVATDLTDSEYLTPHVIAQAEASKAHVTLFHAVLPTEAMPLEAGAIPYVDEAKLDRDARLMLLGMAQEIQAHGIPCAVSVQRGYAADAICAEIRRSGATRLIMATHGRRKLAQMALGSVANELLTYVEIPIFVVGPAAQGRPEHTAPRKILHPVSLEGDYLKSLHLAFDLAQIYRADLTLLHVLDVNPARTVTWAENSLAALIPPGMDLGFAVHTRLASGNVVEEVLNAAAETGADWIVLGVDGAFPFWTFRDTTAYKVLSGAACPVLTVRHEPRAGETAAARAEDRSIAGILA